MRAFTTRSRLIAQNYRFSTVKQLSTLLSQNKISIGSTRLSSPTLFHALEAQKNLHRSFSTETEEVTDEEGSLDSFDIPAEIKMNLEEQGISKLFPVQIETLKARQDDVDLIVKAKTGSGKTLGFGIPLISAILKHRNDPGRLPTQPLALVLAPTRELATQVLQELNKLGGRSIRSNLVVGGMSDGPQIDKFRRPLDLVVATPGRIKDLMERCYEVDFSQTKVSVLDEADEMLKMGFQDSLTAIFENLPPKEDRSNFLFSATFSKEIQQIAGKYMDMNNHRLINLVPKDGPAIPDEIEMKNMLVLENAKRKALGSVLAKYCGDGKQALVFVNTKAESQSISTDPNVRQAAPNLRLACLHGDMSQQLRNTAMQGFKSKAVDVIVATDVAARGLDVPNVDLVLHYDLPASAAGIESFIHRTGRTGRAGNKGVTIAFHGSEDMAVLKQIEKITKRKFAHVKIPSTEENMNEGLNKFTNKVNAQLEKTDSIQIGQKIQTLAESVMKAGITEELTEAAKGQVMKTVSILLASGADVPVSGRVARKNSISPLTGMLGRISFHLKFEPGFEKDEVAATRLVKQICAEYGCTYDRLTMTADRSGCVFDVAAKEVEILEDGREEIEEKHNISLSEVDIMPSLEVRFESDRYSRNSQYKKGGGNRNSQPNHKNSKFTQNFNYNSRNAGNRRNDFNRKNDFNRRDDFNRRNDFNRRDRDEFSVGDRRSSRRRDDFDFDFGSSKY